MFKANWLTRFALLKAKGFCRKTSENSDRINMSDIRPTAVKKSSKQITVSRISNMMMKYFTNHLMQIGLGALSTNLDNFVKKFWLDFIGH